MVGRLMRKILVVEDEMLILMDVADTFREHGFEVLEARDGTQALAILETDPEVAAVFTDVTLPGQPDGFAIARWVRRYRAGVPVILTSGEVTEAHAASIGRDEPFFAKPCDYAAVVAFIRQHLADSTV